MDHGPVARDDDAGSGQVEWLDLDDAHGPDEVISGPPPRHRWPRWTPFVLGLVVVLVVILAVTNRGHRSPSAARSATPSVSPSHLPTVTRSRPPPDTDAASASPSVAPVAVTNLGHSLLGISAPWELFGRGPSSVVRIQFATGRITRTAVPGLGTGSGVTFVVGADRAIVWPLDLVPGFVVPDGRAAQEISQLQDNGGAIVAGPDLNHVWTQTPGEQNIRLSTLDGKPTGVSIRVPAEFGVLASDGDGYIAVQGVGGVYDARPDGLQRVTGGQPLAIGRTRWLAIECDDQARCATVVIDRSTGERRTLGSGTQFAGPQLGAISADGSKAALLVGGFGNSTKVTVHVLDLNSGADHRLPITVSEYQDFGSFVWSPDSRWLFVCDAHARLAAVDAGNLRVHKLGVAVPEVSQLAIRDTPR